MPSVEGIRDEILLQVFGEILKKIINDGKFLCGTKLVESIFVKIVKPFPDRKKATTPFSLNSKYKHDGPHVFPPKRRWLTHAHCYTIGKSRTRGRTRPTSRYF